MEYRGVRYAIRIGIAREQWRVAIHPVANQLPKERTVVGTREDAEITARSMINAWLKEAMRPDNRELPKPKTLLGTGINEDGNG
jgi:hypothetical protein